MSCEIGSSLNEVPRRSPFQIITQLESDKPVEHPNPLSGHVEGSRVNRPEDGAGGESGWLPPRIADNPMGNRSGEDVLADTSGLLEFLSARKHL